MKTFGMMITVLMGLSNLSYAGFGKQDCSAPGIRVQLNESEDQITLWTTRGRVVYAVTDVLSRTGDVDFIYLTGQRVSLTIDDQHGDFVSLNGRSIRLACVNR